MDTKIPRNIVPAQMNNIVTENMDDAQPGLNIFKLKMLSDLKIFILLRAFGYQTIAFDR